MIDVFATTGDTAAVRILRAVAGVRPG
jgi:hypothetical protein